MEKGRVLKINAKYSTIEILVPEGKIVDGIFDLFKDAQIVDNVYLSSQGGYQHFIEDEFEVEVSVKNAKIFTKEEIEDLQAAEKAAVELEAAGKEASPEKPEKGFLDD